MNNGDYVILIDENGQPYIAHSVFTKARDAAKSAARSAHKYIARIGDRYFYTQEELKAFYNRGKAAARKAIGYDAKARYKAAKMRYEDAIDERRRTDDHSGSFKLFSGSDGEHSRKAHDDHMSRAADDLIKAGTEYDRTLLAAGERGKAAAAKAAEAVRGAATKAATTAKSAASSVSKYASDRLGDVSDFVHRRNKAKSPETSGTTDREIDNSANKKGAHDRTDSASTKRQDSVAGTNFRAAFDDLEPGERDKKSKKRLGRRKTNTVGVDPNTDVKGRMDSRNKTHSTDEAKSNAYLDKYQGPISENHTDYEARRQKLLQDIMDAQDATGKVSRYSEEGRRAQEDLERAWHRLGEYYDNIYKGTIDDKYRAGQLTKKKK